MTFVEPVSKVCNDCPFRRKAMPGWLGAGSPESFIDCMQRDEPLPCHQTMDYDDEHWLAKWMLQRNTGKMCAGALTFMSNKLQRYPFQKVDKDHENVFSNTIEFVRHHREAPVHSWNDDEQNEGAQLQRRLIADSAERMGQPIIDNAAKKKRSKSMPKKNQAAQKVIARNTAARRADKAARKPEPTPTEDAIREVEDALEDLARLKIPAEKYVEALEEIHTYVEAALDAARDDVTRAKRADS